MSDLVSTNCCKYCGDGVVVVVVAAAAAVAVILLRFIV